MIVRNVSVVIMFAFALLSGSAHANLLQFDDFSSTVGAVLGGDADVQTTSAGGVVRLLGADLLASRAFGTVFAEQRQDIAAFSTDFVFGVTEGQGSMYVGLLAFVIEGQTNVPTEATVYGNPSFAVDFYMLSANYQPYSHVGVNVNDGTGLNIDAAMSFLSGRYPDQGGLWRAWIDYADDELQVRVSHDLSTRPTDPFLTYAVDLPGLLGTSAAYVGLAGKKYRGDIQLSVDAHSWNYRTGSDLLPVPEPSTLTLLGFGGVALVVRHKARKRGRTE